MMGQGKKKYNHASPFGTATPTGASRVGVPGLGQVIISKLDRPIASLCVDLVPFPTLEVHKSGILP